MLSLRHALRAGLGAAIVGVLLGVPGAAVAQVPIAPPYTLTAPGNTVTVAPFGGGATVAIRIERAGSNVRFTPAATAIVGAGGCTQDPSGLSTTCPASAMSTELRVEQILQVEVIGVATATMRLLGDNDADSISVTAPAAAGETVGILRIFSGSGADAVTVVTGPAAGRITAIHDDSGLADIDADRYVIDAPAITGVLAPAGGNDFVETNATSLAISGGPGDDTLIGPNSLAGGDGNDVLKPTRPQTQVDGGASTVTPAGSGDRVSYDRAPAGRRLALAGSGNVTVDGVATVTGVEEVEGGNGNDIIVGDGGANTLIGGLGDDSFDGLGGSDRIEGGVGTDRAGYSFETAPVTVDVSGLGTGGPAGSVDRLFSIEAVTTGSGNDVVTGSDADESFALGAGDDLIDGGYGNDDIDAGDGNDLLRGGRGNDTLAGGPGTDTAAYDERTSGEPVTVTLGGPGSGGTAGESDVLSAIENATGSAGPDTLTGDAGPNVLSAGAGDDVLSGLGGDDTLLGSVNRDIISGGAGRDGLYGEAGDDTLQAFDNEADVVACGESPDDDAQVDPVDAVSGCEYTRRADIPIPVDNDKDGVAAAFDCDDNDAARRPGATEIPADRIDQNCDGFDEALPFVAATLSHFWRATPSGRRVGSLVVIGLRKGNRVRLSCTPPKARRTACPFKRALTRSPKGSSSRLALTPAFRRRALPKGTVIEVRITGPGYIGKVWRFTIISPQKHSEARRCLTKGTKPQVCPLEER